MSTIRELRDELLARHAELRRAVEDIRAEVERLRNGSGTVERLQVALVLLADGLRDHCAHEDDVLGDIIRSADAWGDARAEMLSTEHVVERSEVEEAVRAVTVTADPELLGAVTLACVERLLEHFAREERFVLAEDVLCDGIVPRNSFCG